MLTGIEGMKNNVDKVNTQSTSFRKYTSAVDSAVNSVVVVKEEHLIKRLQRYIERNSGIQPTKNMTTN